MYNALGPAIGNATCIPVPVAPNKSNYVELFLRLPSAMGGKCEAVLTARWLTSNESPFQLFVFLSRPVRHSLATSQSPEKHIHVEKHIHNATKLIIYLYLRVSVYI